MLKGFDNDESVRELLLLCRKVARVSVALWLEAAIVAHGSRSGGIEQGVREREREREGGRGIVAEVGASVVGKGGRGSSPRWGAGGGGGAAQSLAAELAGDGNEPSEGEGTRFGLASGREKGKRGRGRRGVAGSGEVVALGGGDGRLGCSRGERE
ncbi:hypothetical protein CIPAW_02G079700 [Carya illinoinensis]|uniref:Uncharacterized protein n=1 Tax=Carya illinoinensis TaxID=32201 RepID=A0A8T1RCB9_CARIL|nr:hypothetical protein CIPAW_02G079700 [Carya illinoinensis]